MDGAAPAHQTISTRLADGAAFARLDESANHITNQAADNGAQQRDDEKLAADSATEVTDRKEPQRDDKGFEPGRENGTNCSRDNADENVVQS
jgi:hypothetical protein